MSEDAAISTPATPRPLTLGVFWFTALVTATGLWTGVVSVDSLPELPWDASNPSEPSTADASPRLLPDPFQSILSSEGGIALNSDLTPPHDEQFGAVAPVAAGSVASSGFEREAPRVDSGLPETAHPEPELSLSVGAPASVEVGEYAMVRINLENRTGTTAEKITVTCRFDDHFEFPGSRDGAVRQRLGSLAPGDSRGLAFPLTARQPGRRRLELLVSSDTHAAMTAEQWLEVRPSQSAAVNVSIVGPERRTVGSRAEYVVTVVNSTGSDVPAAAVTLSHDATLALKEVSAGAERRTGLLRWDLGTLRNRERIQIQVEFECTAVVGSSTLTAAVTSSDRPIGAAESRLTVAASPDLELRLSDTADPLESGQQSTFLVEVVNHASEPAREIVLHLVPSRNIEITGAHVRQGSDELDLRALVEVSGLYFQAAPPLEPGGRLSYEIEFKAGAAGAGELRALLQSRMPVLPQEVCERLVINPPRTNG